MALTMGLKQDSPGPSHRWMFTDLFFIHPHTAHKPTVSSESLMVFHLSSTNLAGPANRDTVPSLTLHAPCPILAWEQLLRSREGPYPAES